MKKKLNVEKLKQITPPATEGAKGGAYRTVLSTIPCEQTIPQGPP
jgi:hypothetical protein